MLVAALPRCGATKYCLDLQNSTGLEFIGELNPIYLDQYSDTAKRDNHETRFQPLYSMDKFVEALTDHSKYIVLVNQSPHLVLHNSDCLLLRRNMYNAFLSQANFFIKCRPYLYGEGVLQHLYLSFQSFVGVVACISKLKYKDIVWYEDYFGIDSTTTELLDAHPHSRLIKRHIKSMFNKDNEIIALFEEIKNASSR